MLDGNKGKFQHRPWTLAMAAFVHDPNRSNMYVKPYIILGGIENEQQALVLVMDGDGVEYTVSTEDYVPRRIQAGERDDLRSKQVRGGRYYFEIGTKLTLTTDNS